MTNTTQRTATARIALDPIEYAFPVAVRGAGTTLQVYDGEWVNTRKDSHGRYFFLKKRADGIERDLVTFLTDLE